MRLKHYLWMRLGGNPVGLHLLGAYTSWTGADAAVVTTRCALVAEGYPRSANTYFVAAFRLAQEGRVDVGHHIHGNQQVFRGLKLGVPTVVLIRSPLDALVSLLVRDPRVSPRQGIKDYLLFYEPLLSSLGKFVVADFDRAVGDPDEIILEVNARYGSSFRTLKDAGITEAEVMSAVKRMDMRDSRAEKPNPFRAGMPSSEKIQMAETVRQHILEVRSRDRRLFDAAQWVYERFVTGGSRGDQGASRHISARG